MLVADRTCLLRIAAFAAWALMRSASPASAQIDLSGQWTATLHEDIGYRLDEPALANGIDGAGGPRIGDYTGLPLNDAGRFKADSWDARINTVPEHQTIIGTAAVWVFGGGRTRITSIIDPGTERLVGYKIYRINVAGTATSRTIWLDGRPHPPEYAANTWSGFSTGTWQGEMLTVVTTHIKAAWVRRNGAPASDRAVITEHFVRHGNVLTTISIVTDPIYLEEPLIQSSSLVLDPAAQLPDPVPNVIVDEIPGRPDGFVPHHLPGTNTAVTELSDRFGIPFESTRGGRETTYPEYQLTIQRLRQAKSKTPSN